MQLKVSAYFEKWHYRLMILLPFFFFASSIVKVSAEGLIEILAFLPLMLWSLAGGYIHSRTGTVMIDSEGITSKRPFRYRSYKWINVRQVGIGTSRIFSRCFYWIYFTSVPLTADEMESLPVKRHASLNCRRTT